MILKNTKYNQLIIISMWSMKVYVPDKGQEPASAVSGLVRFFSLNLVIYISFENSYTAPFTIFSQQIVEEPLQERQADFLAWAVDKLPARGIIRICFLSAPT